jgi:NADH-quinone oxidoreductase subunit C
VTVPSGPGDQTPAVPVVPSDATPLEVVEVRTGSFGVHGSGDTSGFGGLRRVVTMPAAAERPFGFGFDEVIDEVEACLEPAGVPASAIERVVVDREELTVYVEREHLLGIARMLRDEPGLRYEICMGVSGVHWPQDTGRELHVVIHLLSITHNRRMRLETTCPDGDSHVPSLVPVYPAADWHERETFDFFGVVFDGHPALTRIMMPDDWPGHPQRKDYPLGGIPVEYKGATIPPPDQRRQYT